MDPQIILRKIAAAAVDLVGLRHAAGDDLDAGIEREPVALGAGQLEADPMASGDAVIAQNHRAAVDIADDDIHIAVIEEIAHSKSARDATLFECRPSLVAGIAERAVLLVQVKQFGLAIASARGQRIHLRIDMAVDCNQIEPAVVVEIDKCGPPLHPRQRGQRDARRRMRPP